MKKKIYGRIARLYDLLDLPFEHFRYKPLRQELFDAVTAGFGNIPARTLLDAGVGTGRNFIYYPAGAKVIAIDLSPAMLARATQRKKNLSIDVDLHEMSVLNLGFANDHFDGIVSTFMFCVLDSDLQLPALKELCRVCRPDGTIYILEYAISQNPLRRWIMKLWAPWVRFAYGAEFDRNTEQYLDAAGLELIDKKFLHKDIIKLLLARPKLPAA